MVILASTYLHETKMELDKQQNDIENIDQLYFEWGKRGFVVTNTHANLVSFFLSAWPILIYLTNAPTGILRHQNSCQRHCTD